MVLIAYHPLGYEAIQRHVLLGGIKDELTVRLKGNPDHEPYHMARSPRGQINQLDCSNKRRLLPNNAHRGR